MTLHTLNKERSDLVRLCIGALASGDSLLLFEDGVYAALSGLDPDSLPGNIKLFALSEDLSARGLREKIPAVFERITYRDFVSLSMTCSKVVNWN